MSFFFINDEAIHYARYLIYHKLHKLDELFALKSLGLCSEKEMYRE